MPEQRDSVSETLRRYRAEADRWQAAYRLDQEREDALRGQLGTARARLALQPEAQRLLEATQRRLHEKSLGTFETLLTALIRDVLQGDQTIRMHLDAGRGIPALSIAVERDGCEEDVWDGNGGALTNTVCAGLRLIALARSGLRPFLLLDEADNWCSPAIVPQFVSVFADLAATAQVQTLFISHHDPLLFDPRTHLVHLSKIGDQTEAREQATPEWEAGQPGIRYIRLQDVRRFVDSTVVLAPGVNALIGSNSAGKSTVASALRGVAYGDSNDGLIRHGAKQARVELGLEDGRILEWTRQAKGSPKMRWALKRADGSVERESTSAKGLPEWLGEILGIARLDGLDIQLLHQKTPIFLLNETATKQASVLSVGQEAGHLPELMARYRKMVQDDQATVRSGELELDAVLNRLRRFQGLDQVADQLSGAENAASACEASDQRLQSLKGLGGQLIRATDQALGLERELSPLQDLPERPALHDVQALAQALALQARIEQISRMTVPAMVPDITLRPVAELAWQEREWCRLARLVQEPLPDLADLPQLRATAEILAIGEQWVSAEREFAGLEAAMAASRSAEADARTELENYLHELGDACPLCGQHLEKFPC
ncbi:AAA family ATPase [Thiomonas sp.]